jgi:magnesium chelatase family protein
LEPEERLLAVLMRLAVERMGLSARAYHRVLKLSRTIADLAGNEAVQQRHLSQPSNSRRAMS